MIVKTIDELRQHIGVIGDNDIMILRPFLKRSKRYLTDIISNDVYITALNHYDSDDYRNVNEDDYQPVDDDTAILDNLVDKVQDALIYYAHYLYSPEANVIMTDNGFRVPWSDTVRPAQEWQINKVEKSILESSHELIDQLIEFLDENVDSIDSWDGSDAIVATRARFINSAKDFNTIFYINNSGRIFLLLKPIITEVQRKYILPIIGKERFDTILDQIKDGDLQPENEDILDYINPALAFRTMEIAAKRIPKDEISKITNLDPTDLHDTAVQELQNLENYIASLDNLTLSEDEQKPTTIEASFTRLEDDEIQSLKSISV